LEINRKGFEVNLYFFYKYFIVFKFCFVVCCFFQVFVD